VVGLGDQMDRVIRDNDRKINVELEGRLDSISRDIEIIRKT